MTDPENNEPGRRRTATRAHPATGVLWPSIATHNHTPLLRTYIMPNWRDKFPSKYLKHADLNGQRHLLTIDRVPDELVGQGKDAEQVKPASRMATPTA